jgi:pimeloyl-ACP methyl ester carboxylesterase
MGSVLSLVLVTALAAGPSRAPAAEAFVPGRAGEPRLFLRHRAPAAHGNGGGRVVLFVHGATFPSGLAAAWRFGDRPSWMDDLSARGFDVWALDFAGYGRSDGYPAMARPATEHAPLGRTRDAVRQIARAAQHIRRATSADRIALVAHSWGTLPAALFAQEHASLVDRLVLFGPIAPDETAPPADPAAPAWHDVTLADQWDGFGHGVPDGETRPLSRADFDVWGAAYLATDPGSSARHPSAVRVPFGPIADAHDAAAGRLPYDPARIVTPTLLVRGAWDAVTTAAHLRWLEERLAAAPVRALTLPRGTHRMHVEENRQALFDAVASFLLEQPAPALLRSDVTLRSRSDAARESDDGERKEETDDQGERSLLDRTVVRAPEALDVPEERHVEHRAGEAPRTGENQRAAGLP